jgi:hypothetical protein
MPGRRPKLGEGGVSVGAWIAPVLTLILLVGVGCYLAGWVGHSTYRQEYEAQRRAQRVLAPAAEPDVPAVSCAAPSVLGPLVVTFYLATQHPQNGVVIHAHSPAPLPVSPDQRWAARVVDPVRELP